MRRASGEPAGAAIPRVIVLWCPDWPITAALHETRLAPDAAIALIAQGVVYAASAAARAEGVTRGIRLREAQARCPALVVQEYDPAVDNRVFEPIIAGLEQLTPHVQVLRPGVCAVRVRGVAQYFGGEKGAALALAGRMDELGAGGGSGASAGPGAVTRAGVVTRVGVADGIFTAELAARSTPRVQIVAGGGSAQFLSPLDVGLLDDGGPTGAGIVTLLRRLGIRTLGGFAALPADDVRIRFGEPGRRLHALASGKDSWPLTPRTPPDDFDVVVDFEPALDRVDQVAFGVRTASEEFIDRLTAARLVCTAIRVELLSDSAETSERVWLHPRSFTPADVVDRVRWQVSALELGGTRERSRDASADEAALRRSPYEISSGIIRVRIAPDAVDAIGHHEAGLWGTGPDERIHHGLSRVQSMLGHGAVLMPSVGGGRSLGDRQQLVAWGDRPVGGRSAAQPWPGRLPTPLPGTVFGARHAVHVFGPGGAVVEVDERGALSAAPAELSAGRTVLRIDAWAGPWPIDERWWSADARRAWRFQAVDSTGCAWLLVLDDSGWWAEARYD